LVREGMSLVLVGLGIGLVVALGAGRAIPKASWLYGISSWDPLTFTVVPLLLLAVALLASILPARRATRIDPVQALRHD